MLTLKYKITVNLITYNNNIMFKADISEFKSSSLVNTLPDGL